MKGIEKCVNLIKLDVTNNRILSFDGLNAIKLNNNELEKLYIAGNRLQDLDGLQWLANCDKIKEIVFTKSTLTNPLCENYGNYIFVLN